MSPALESRIVEWNATHATDMMCREGWTIGIRVGLRRTLLSEYQSAKLPTDESVRIYVARMAQNGSTVHAEAWAIHCLMIMDGAS